MNSLAKISLQYALSNAPEETLSRILAESLSPREKLLLLLELDEERIKEILVKLGFKEEFLYTI